MFWYILLGVLSLIDLVVITIWYEECPFNDTLCLIFTILSPIIVILILILTLSGAVMQNSVKEFYETQYLCEHIDTAPDWLAIDKMNKNDWLSNAQSLHTKYHFFSLYEDSILTIEPIK